MQSLFRKEVVDQRADRLQGNVSIAVPISWQVISYGLFVVLVIVVAFLSLASYSRVATATGIIVVDKGVAAIMPTRAGVVAGLVVRDGQSVEEGAPLAVIRSEEELRRGGTAPDRVRNAVQQQDRQLASQQALLLKAAQAEQARLAAQSEGITKEIIELDRQTAAQRRLIEVAANELNQARSLADRGFISRRDLETRESTLLIRQQQLAQLEQVRATRRSSVLEAGRSIAQAEAAAQGQSAAVQSERAELAQQLAQAEAAEGYTLTSPVSGRVTAMTARLGQAALPDQALMSVVPTGGTLQAELHVPTSAAGFLEIGQQVRLSIDAFPFQQFGTVEASIAEISAVASPKIIPQGGAVPIYLVRARLSRDTMQAFGRNQALLPGMTLSARIVTQRRSLLEWLFEPLFAMRQR